MKRLLLFFFALVAVVFWASAAFAAQPAATIDQGKNGGASSPTSPMDWVNGNLNSSGAHYTEHYSIPYRAILTNVPSGSHTLQISYDTRKGGKAAIDYLTQFNRINDPSHSLLFGHSPEAIDPTIGITGLPSPNTFGPLPAPSSFPGTLVPDADRFMTIYNGTISSVVYSPSENTTLTGDQTQQVTVSFTATSTGTVVIAWGGHIARQADWGTGNSAINISGSPYHMRLDGWDLGTIGNQDRSLAAAAVTVPNTFSIQKFRATSSTDTSSTDAKTWVLKLKTGGNAGTTISSSATGSLGVTQLSDGTYTACEVDSVNWSHVGYKNDGLAAVLSTDTCVTVVVAGGQNASVSFWNAQLGSITVQKFRATSATDTASGISKPWLLKLKTGSAAGGTIASSTTGSVSASGLFAGTYFACEFDSASWTHVGYKNGSAGAVIATDTCVQVNLSAGQNTTVKFWNFKPNSITIQKFQGTSSTDTSASASAKTWGLFLRTGSSTGGSVNSGANVSSLASSNLADGTYFACEADSTDWAHIGNKLDNAAALLNGNNCVTVTVSAGQSRTVKFWNFKANSITIRKFQASSATDSSTSVPKNWFLKLKSGAPAGGGAVLGSGSTTALVVANLADGTYSACEADSAAWTHTRSQVNGNPTKAFVAADTCVQVIISGGSSNVVRFWNTPPNSITIQKFRSTSSTDTSAGAAAKVWRLILRSGTSAGTIVNQNDVSSLATSGLADGTYFACEADSASWTHVGNKLDNAAALLNTNTCVQVVVSAGQSRTVKFWNSPPSSITILKFRAKSATDTSSTLAKKWRLKLKTGSAGGGAVSQADTSALVTSGLADGTYFACEVDSTGWKHVGYKLDGTAAVISSTDTCITVAVNSGASRTVRFYNFHRNKLTVQKFEAGSVNDTVGTLKEWGLKLRSGSQTAAPLASDNVTTLTVDADSVADGTYFACEVDSSGWTHVRYQVDNLPTVPSGDSCVTVVVNDGTILTVRFLNFKPRVDSVYCSLTQGFYGNIGGKFFGFSTRGLIDYLLTFGQFRVGIGGSPTLNSLVIPSTAAGRECIIFRLPAGGPPITLGGPNTIGDVTMNTSICRDPGKLIPLTKDKDSTRFRNVFLGQLITLKLNARLHNASGKGNLSTVVLKDSFCVADSGSDTCYKVKLDSTVMAYLKTAYPGGGHPNVTDLIKSADSAISGIGYATTILKKISSVVGTINGAFDGCRVLLSVCCASPLPFHYVEEADDAASEEAGAVNFKPAEYSLHQSYPNPFNPSTIIRFDIPTASTVTLKVYNVLGQEVATLINGEFREAGRYDVRFDASRLSSGVYFYRLSAGPFTSIKKMLLMK
jgi:hypothetical protein